MLGVDDIFRDIFQGPAGFKWAMVGWLDVIRILLDAIQLLLVLGNIAAAFFIIWNAYGYATAFGSEEKVKKAKQGITAAVTGVVIITLSYFLIHWVYVMFVGADKIPNEIQNTPKEIVY
ncbi:MAG: amino acid permease [bacterium]|nr:amino acid permease [bacterium]